MSDDSVGGAGTGDIRKGGGGVVRRRWDGQCTPSVAVIEAVAAATGQDPTELPLLERTVDPEAIDALFDGGTDTDRSVYLSFAYGGTEVTIGDDGELTVDPRRGAR